MSVEQCYPTEEKILAEQPNQQVAPQSKYQHFPIPGITSSRKAIITLGVSHSERKDLEQGGKRKNYVAQEFSHNVESLQDTEDEVQNYVQRRDELRSLNKIIDEINSTIFETYASRIYAASNPGAPKCKFIGCDMKEDNNSQLIKFSFGSRMPALDGATLTEEYIEIVKVLNLKFINDTLSKNTNEMESRRMPKVFPGLLEAIVYRTIMEDWDTKLQNFTAYPQYNESGKEYFLVHPYDFEYVTGTEPDRIKDWQQDEISSIIFGNDTESGNKSVAEALTETLGGLGKRTDPYYLSAYYDMVDNNITKLAKFDARCDVIKEKQIIMDSLAAELSEIDQDHSVALLKKFVKVMGDIKKNQQQAHDKALVDTSGKTQGLMQALGQPDDYIANKYKEYQEMVLGKVEKFEGFIKNIQAALAQKGTLQSRDDITVGVKRKEHPTRSHADKVFRSRSGAMSI